MVAARVLALAVHCPAAERIDVGMVGGEGNRSGAMIKNSINVIIDRNHVAIQVAEPIRQAANVGEQIGLQVNARLMVAHGCGGHTHANDLIMGSATIAACLDDYD